MPDRFYEVPAVGLATGMRIDDDRFRHVMDVRHVVVGRKWVRAWSFHPEAHVYPNAPIKVRRDETVRVLRSTLPADYFGGG